MAHSPLCGEAQHLRRAPSWYTLCQQSQRWLKAGVFGLMLHDLRAVLRLAQGRTAKPSAAIGESRTLQSTPESGTRAGYDGAKRRRGSKVPMAVDILGYLLAERLAFCRVRYCAAEMFCCVDTAKCILCFSTASI